MKFENYSISSEIKHNLDLLGFKRPTDIQFKSIPNILKGEDVLAIAQTGTGKTAAFAIPVLNILQDRLRNRRTEGVKCIVMVPTRELGIQITEVFKLLGRKTGVETFCVFGGVEQGPQIAKLQDGIDILVTTPGRMFDLVSQGHLLLHRVEILILDEADHMLDLGFIKDIRDLLKFLPKRRQTLFFSATINANIKKLAYSLVNNNAIRIQLSPDDPVTQNVEHSVAFVDMDDKRFFLERLINEHPDEKIIVFVRTKVRAERVLKAMERVEISAATIHSDKEQKDRFTVMDRFKSGELKVLIATDVSARGIDFPHVQYVVNYDLPDKAENYVHRIGRTGRGKERGFAVSFCSPEEQEMLKEIEGFITKKIKVMELSNSEYQKTVDFSQDASTSLKELMQEAEAFENRKKKKRKK
ncbi:MAG: DEAD/DEAH box helicase [Saprospiraceae bacterium]|nr:DEAD/DEAH box helicase [Saprospiraceae bacterium]MCB9326829.1 DEAD/DEAH box helicase [Lewinellaceae bacterium]